MGFRKRVFEDLVAEMKILDFATVHEFGKFEVVSRPARQARNPKTGEIVNVPARKVVRFKASKKLNEKFNP